MHYSFLVAGGKLEIKILIITSIISLLLRTAQSQSLNYPEIFGDDWSKAVAYEKENRGWMEKTLAENKISYPFAIAIVFPELVRYSALRDKMEITLLKTLYVNLGEEYADFSVGVFQMKPSFAEIVRKELTDSKEFKNRSEFQSVAEYRKSIIIDLEDPKMQMNYLIAFIKICTKHFETSGKDELSKLSFFATVYNCGIDKSYSAIDSMANKKFFNTKLFTTQNYSYQDISLYWYRQFVNKTGQLKCQGSSVPE